MIHRGRPSILSLRLWIVVAAASLLLGCAEIVGLGPSRTLAEAGGGGGGGGHTSAGGDGGSGGSPEGLCGGDVAWLRTFGDASYDFVGSPVSDGDGGLYFGAWFAGGSIWAKGASSRRAIATSPSRA